MQMEQEVTLEQMLEARERRVQRQRTLLDRYGQSLICLTMNVAGPVPWERAAYRWCAESSVYLAPEARGRGVGKALYQALEDILRRQGYRTLYALVTTDNEASIGFHEAIGFVRRAFFPNCGYKLGTWHGVVWLEKQLAPPDAPTSFPEPWCREEHSI